MLSKVSNKNMIELKTTFSTAFFSQFCPDPTVTFDLPELYSEFNAKYFEGKLPLIKTVTKVDENGEEWVTTRDIRWDGKYKKLWGTYKANGRGTGTIKLARQAALDPVQVRSTLLHECVHKYLDSVNKDTGIKGHGETFIQEANRINALCEERGVAYRVNYYDVAIVKEQPEVYCDLLKTTIYCGKDLDIARHMRSVLNMAFDTKYEYEQ